MASFGEMSQDNIIESHVDAFSVLMSASAELLKHHHPSLASSSRYDDFYNDTLSSRVCNGSWQCCFKLHYGQNHTTLEEYGYHIPAC